MELKVLVEKHDSVEGQLRELGQELIQAKQEIIKEVLKRGMLDYITVNMSRLRRSIDRK